MPSRVLSPEEFDAVKAKVLASAPPNLPDEASFTRWAGPAMAQALGEAENLPPAPEGSAVGRFVSNAAEMLNPVSLGKGVYQAVRHPIDTATQIATASADQAHQAADLYHQGRYIEAGGHALATLPLVGPIAAQAGEQIAAGDVAGGLGKTAGLLAPFGAPAVARGVARVAPESVAAALDTGAAARVADVMAPKVGANKVRFGGMAEKVAPALAADPEMAAWSREGLHAQVGAKLEQASAALDDAADARNAKLVYYTTPILKDLQGKLNDLTAATVKSGAVKAGEDVIPSPNAARAASIQQAMAEVKQLGPVASYESLRRIRQAWDGPAKAVYSPAMTTDFLKAQGGKLGAADVTSVLRDKLASFDPATAKANTEYSLYKTANDVLDATAEVERTRPQVGRQIMARLTGSIVGEQAGGLPGAAAGFVLGPVLQTAVSSGVTTKIQTAQVMSKLASAIRRGDVGHVASLTVRLRRLGTQAATVLGSTIPNESPTQTTATAPSTP